MEILNWTEGEVKAIVLLSREEVAMLDEDFEETKVGKGMPQYTITKKG